MNCTCLRASPAAAPRWLRAGSSPSASISGNGRWRLRRKPARYRGLRTLVLPQGRGVVGSSPWDEKPFELLPGGRISYLDEQDIVTLLDPPKELVPLDPASYNPAAYLWKKISDIPEERRHRLLYSLNARLISRLWQLLGTRYLDAKLTKQNSSSLLSMGDTQMPSEVWDCRKSSGPFPITWINDFKKVIFHGKDGCTYGHLFFGSSLFRDIANSFSPLYFTVRVVTEVMSTEQPCDLAYEFDNGLLDPAVVPDGFPVPEFTEEILRWRKKTWEDERRKKVRTTCKKVDKPSPSLALLIEEVKGCS